MAARVEEMGRGREKKGEEEVSGSISNSATSPK